MASALRSVHGGGPPVVRLAVLVVALLVAALGFARWAAPRPIVPVPERDARGEVPWRASPELAPVPVPPDPVANSEAAPPPPPGVGEAARDPRVRVHGLLSPAPGRADPLGGIPVFLVAASGETWRTETDVLGRFEALAAAGQARLVVGDPEAPLLPPEDVDLLAPVTALGERLLPALGVLDVEVVDATGQPVPGARIDGRGERGGVVRGEADARGRLRALHLPAGSYRLFATDPVAGRGNRPVELSPDTPATVRMVLFDGPPLEPPSPPR